MDKNKRDIDLMAMKLIAQNIAKLFKEGYVLGIWPRFSLDGQDKIIPSVHLSREGFFDYFEDAAYRYTADGEYVYTFIEDVQFYALLEG